MNIDSNLLLIGGSAQNVGKTSFTIDLLKTYSKDNDIIAIKTSCHFHGILDTDIVVANNDKFVVVKETVTDTGKDSARMLEAGAKEVFFIQAADEFIGEAYDFLINKLDKKTLIICETASLRKYVVPKIFLALVKEQNEELEENKSILNMADFFVVDYLNFNDKYADLVAIKNNKWKINTKYIQS